LVGEIGTKQQHQGDQCRDKEKTAEKAQHPVDKSHARGKNETSIGERTLWPSLQEVPSRRDMSRPDDCGELP